MSTKIVILSSSIAAALAWGSISIVQAASTATVNVNVVFPVTTPACTLTNSASEINMPPAASTITANQYFSKNGFTVSPVNSGWVTLSSLLQTTTFSCDTPNTPISSFSVLPASGAVTFNGKGRAYLVDASATPVKAANGGVIIGYGQATINGTSVPYNYDNGYDGQAYTTTFFTSPLLNVNQQSVATVQWYPQFYPIGGGNVMGTPTGGQFSTPATITVQF